MLNIYVKYITKPNCRDLFLRRVAEEGIQTAVRAEEGCICYDYYLSTEDENLILLSEKWVSAEHQRIHLLQPHMARLMELKAQYVEDTLKEKMEVPDDF